MEEDAEEHARGLGDSEHKTYVDLNRTGTQLAEIVSEPKSALRTRLLST